MADAYYDPYNDACDEWTPVLTRKEKKVIAAMCRKEAERDAKVEHFLRVVSTAPSVQQGPVTHWPAVAFNKASPLLSECIGSTKGKDFLAQFPYLSMYQQFVTFMTNYPHPIYHIDYETQEDMGYDDNGERAPYIDNVILSVWTYASNEVPVIHEYVMNVMDMYGMDGYTNPKRKDPNTVRCDYLRSCSPVAVCINQQSYCEENYVDCTMRMMELAGAVRF